jgi:integrase
MLNGYGKLKTDAPRTSQSQERSYRQATRTVAHSPIWARSHQGTTLKRQFSDALLGDPKTDDSIRVVELSPQACAHLRTFLKSWHPNERRLLFATCNGTPWDQNLLLKRKFRPLLRSLGIQVPRGNGFHAFRHANATLMNSFGASQKLRQQRLGHADGSPVTDTIYTHVISEDGKRIAAQLGKAIWGVLDPSWRAPG